MATHFNLCPATPLEGLANSASLQLRLATFKQYIGRPVVLPQPARLFLPNC